MRDVSEVYLQDRHSGQIVIARLYDGITEEQLENVEKVWRPELRAAFAGRPRSAWPQSWHWDWRAKMESVRDLLAYRGFAIEYGGQTQGLMLVKTTEICRIPEQKGKSMVYVDYLETAPWNQREVVATPRFRGIGTVMLAAAISSSREEGFSGRIGLHSLPQSEDFYKKCGFMDLGHDPEKQNLCYFEMTPDKAVAFLAK